MRKTALVLSVLLAAFSAVSCSSTNDTASSQAEESVTSAAVTEAETETETTADETEAETEAETETEAAETETNELDLSALSTFEISSEDLHDGVWDSDITNTMNGSNRSPQLSWQPVDGASDYVVYMIDTTAGNWVHMKVVTEGATELPAGCASEKEYVGPYPPEGTHDYEIYAFALREPAKKVRAALNVSSPNFFELIKSLDNDGGNVIAYGHTTGTYTKGE